eukprot:gnl/MRDRNA2_/MRDRNA2_85405_c0_seq1.p1 gnl/MRDRNA2_/MRDRNA2_85405_c0~~gnl/MRDRNA2_/MRDRNA2_85405_c0_seq1.p1  ORF type:complete len:203 (+),score=12.38 gnl/MRDRNA2_/MRDRNA2_85405_c0_seq1:74-682(+)
MVVLDDHMSSVKRSWELVRSGFVHLWFDDNQNGNYEGSDCYSFNDACTAAKGSAVIIKSNFGQSTNIVTADDHHWIQKWLRSHIEVYFEFPALLDGCASHPNHSHQQSLFSSEAEVLQMGLPSIAVDRNHYLHLYPPYVKLKILESELKARSSNHTSSSSNQSANKLCNALLLLLFGSLVSSCVGNAHRVCLEKQFPDRNAI